MPHDPHAASRRPPAADRELTRLLRDARRAQGPPMDPRLPDRVLQRLGLSPPTRGPRTRARGEHEGRPRPEGRGRRQALLVGLLALLALLALPAGARGGARLAQAPGWASRPSVAPDTRPDAPDPGASREPRR